MRNFIFTIILIGLSTFMLKSCIIQNPKQDDCVSIDISIKNIYEGTSYDIVFEDTQGDLYYINRGLKYTDLTIEKLNKQILNKKVTLHLPKFLIGTSEHIAQLQVNNIVLYTEFNN